MVDGTLFSARVEATRVAPLHAPLAVRRAGRTIGVAVLLDVVDGRALGFAVARSLTVPLETGDVLTVSPEHLAPLGPSASSSLSRRAPRL